VICLSGGLAEEDVENLSCEGGGLGIVKLVDLGRDAEANGCAEQCVREQLFNQRFRKAQCKDQCLEE
jgi:hypothetical protein